MEIAEEAETVGESRLVGLYSGQVGTPTKFLAWLEVDCATRALVYALDLASLYPYGGLASRYYYRHNNTTSQPTIPHVGTPTNGVIFAHYIYSPNSD